MIGVLIVECSRRIEEPVLKPPVPVSVNVLRECDANHLFGLATYHVGKFGIRAGGCIKFCVFGFQTIYIIGMKSIVPSRLQVTVKNKIMSCIAGIAEINIIPRNRKFFSEIKNG